MGLYRFHNPAEEPELNRDVVPYLDDNVQLSIEEYRDKLYEVCTYIHVQHEIVFIADLWLRNFM